MSETVTQPQPEEVFVPPLVPIPTSRSAQQFTDLHRSPARGAQPPQPSSAPRIPLSASFNNNPAADRNQNVYNGVQHRRSRPTSPPASNGSAGKAKKASIPVPTDPRRRLLSEKFPLPSYSALSPYKVRQNIALIFHGAFCVNCGFSSFSCAHIRLH